MSAPVVAKRRLKVVFLHGLTQTAETFRQQTGAFRKTVTSFIDVVYVDAPHLIRGYPVYYDEARALLDDAQVSRIEDELRKSREAEMGPRENHGRTWYCTESLGKYSSILRNCELLGFEESFEKVLEACETENADGIMGFSQGASMVTLFLKRLLQHKGSWRPKFCVLFSGPMPANVHLRNILNEGPPISIPSLHLLGEKDLIVTSARALPLIDYYTNAEIHNHKSGHVVPHTECKQVYRSFFKRMLDIADESS
ncbi:bifunctional Alpha-Beta hydrolase fold/Serine hydrolase FSH [Babesia duncani]|uniref:Bifunctional Alpha-Beta hydrolase fold/Serine hydrolase FSH n=1 Tax=Babesia duncani TaxID=323732 RepID=A0AAD9PMI7_9APIC|nr:bifunctional Alpha-Beta hydrolase fold/Serine hydrolase FSH [Babesia duncani]